MHSLSHTRTRTVITLYSNPQILLQRLLPAAAIASTVPPNHYIYSNRSALSRDEQDVALIALHALSCFGRRRAFAAHLRTTVQPQPQPPAPTRMYCTCAVCIVPYLLYSTIISYLRVS